MVDRKRKFMIKNLVSDTLLTIGNIFRTILNKASFKKGNLKVSPTGGDLEGAINPSLKRLFL